MAVTPSHSVSSSGLSRLALSEGMIWYPEPASLAWVYVRAATLVGVLMLLPLPRIFSARTAALEHIPRESRLM